jgi:hypothetical protein
MEKHKFFLLPLKSEGNDRKEGLEKYDYMLILKTTPLENDKYHLILNVTFPVNLFIDLSDEILYSFDSVEKFCLLDLAKQKGRYVNILGTIYDHLTKNIILEKIWIKVENILLFGEVGTGVDSRINYYILTNFKESDNESKKYFLMKKMYSGIHQNFQIVSASMKRESQQKNAKDNFYCENNLKEKENDLNIGDEISIIGFDDKLRETSRYDAFTKDKKFILSDVHNFICIKYELMIIFMQ